ncbi:MAG: hypothetical protein FJW31_11080 [Acidobacteria bacterium]|nr:hypothetical protein [Acidobacteriota bacterium]
MSRLLLLLTVFAFTSCQSSALVVTGKAPAPAAQPWKASKPLDPEFWKVWSDGHAEIASYDLTYPRYGKPRTGLAVTIFVAESFSWEVRVKADPGRHSAADVFPVMKMNLIEDFQTGIYDYNEQTSAFLALADRPEQQQALGHLTKVSFSSQEWCGHSWAQWLFQPAGLRFNGHSYFDGEADAAMDLPRPEGGVSEEQLFFWARGMAEPKLEAGASVDVPFLRSLQYTRHAHKPIAWTSAKLTRATADTYTAEIKDGPKITFQVETAAPYRILRWESTDGERAVLVKSERSKYWQLNKPEGDAELSRLGLRRRPVRTP